MSSGKILVVDDSDSKRAIYRKMLEEDGYNVTEAKDGEEALAKARAASPDVIITDLVMPGIDGFKLTKTLKSDEKTKYVPIICVSTTYADLEHKLKALNEVGAEEFFYMPENVTDFLVKVQVMMRVRRLYLELLEKNKQLKQFNDVAVARELKMIELKEKIKKLETELAKLKK